MKEGWWELEMGGRTSSRRKEAGEVELSFLLHLPSLRLVSLPSALSLLLDRRARSSILRHETMLSWLVKLTQPPSSLPLVAFAGFWMSDKPLVQQALASELSSLVLLVDPKGVDTLRERTLVALEFVGGFWEATVREWSGIDRLR